MMNLITLDDIEYKQLALNIKIKDVLEDIIYLKEENRRISDKIKSLGIRQSKAIQEYKRSGFKSYLKEFDFLLDIKLYLSYIKSDNSKDIRKMRSKLQQLRNELKDLENA